MYACDLKAVMGKIHAGSTAVNGLVRQVLKRFAVSCAVFVGAVACISEHDPQPSARSEADQTQAAEADSGSLGLAYAQENCAACHAVMPGQSGSPNPLAPTFESLANRPGMSRMALSALLQTPHRTMPNLMIDPDRIDDLSAYIAMLGKEPR